MEAVTNAERPASIRAQSSGSGFALGDLPAIDLEGSSLSLERLGSYRIEGVLGRGGMGEVFLARDERLHRHVAIKRIRADFPVSGCHRERFRCEARAAARLSHPAIVQVHDLLETPEGDYIVMERVEGRSLAELITRGEIDLRLALRLGVEIAEGLAEAHAKGLIHRDLKPENVLVTAAEHAKILDFGLARMLWSEGDGDLSGGLTQAGTLVGTVHAMSPEQASGREVDHRSDLFALGSLLYEMLTGRSPFRGQHWLDALRRVTSEEPEPLGAVRPELPAGVAALVEQLLNKDPELRPPNARLVAQTLERLRDNAPAEPPAWPEALAVGSVASRVAVTDAPTAEWPQPPAGLESKVETAVRTLLRIERVEQSPCRSELEQAEIAARYDRGLRELVASHGGIEVEKGEGFLALFERPIDAVTCALAHHRAQGAELRARAAVHLGEVLLCRNRPEEVSRGARALEVEGSAKVIVARLAALGAAGQTLLTRGAFDLARRASGEDDLTSSLCWLAHGSYRFDGVVEPVEVFEVGLEGAASLAPPPNIPKAQRMLAPSVEQVLGWRPAGGQKIPRREHWVLTERVGEGGFGEAWLARHRTGELRVFKFCFDAARLRALKREVTIFSLLKEELGHREDITRILDWQLEEPPFFVESEYTESGNLVRWAAEQGGLGAVALATRLRLVAEVAEALAAAHSVGVLHKDVKPENVLITHDREGLPRARLTDFGIGQLTGRERLQGLGHTALGFTATLGGDSSTGTLGYLAPELVEGKAATLQADVYSLGVLLYQLVVADLGRTLAPGWERDVDDKLLAADIADFVDGRPERRAASALEVAKRLRTLEPRRQARAEEETCRRALESAQKRRRVTMAVAAVALLVLAVVAVMAVRENKARREADRLAESEREARQEADRRRQQTEAFFGSLLDGLPPKLEASGRLDILDDFTTLVLGYFTSVASEQLSVKELGYYNQVLNQIGDVRFDAGNYDGALEAYENAFELARDGVEKEPGSIDWQLRLGAGHFYFGRVFWQQGQLEKAAHEFRAQLELAQRLADLYPGDARVRRELAHARNNVGSWEKEQGNFEVAVESFRAALNALTELLAQQPGDPELQMEVSNQAVFLGQLLWKMGAVGEARALYEQGLSLAETLVTEDSADTGRRLHLAIIHNILGHALRAVGDLQAARRHFEQHCEISKTLVAVEPERVDWQLELAVGRVAVGRSLLDVGELPAGAASVREGLRILSQLQNAAPSLWFERELAVGHVTLGEILMAGGGRLAAQEEALAAVSWFEREAEPNPDELGARQRLSRGLLLLGRTSEDPESARRAWRRAVKLLEPRAGEVRDLETLGLLHQLFGLLDLEKEAASVWNHLVELRKEVSAAKPLGPSDGHR